jgi:hypothetical protein
MLRRLSGLILEGRPNQFSMHCSVGDSRVPSLFHSSTLADLLGLIRAYFILEAALKKN